MFSLLTIVGHVLIIMAGVLLVLLRGQIWPSWLVRIGEKGLWLAWAIAVIAMGGSLLYSDVIGLEPCLMCWFQRICMYPLVVILGLAAYWKDSNIVRYALPLAGIGAALATYHYSLQLGMNPYAPCSAVGYSVSCSDRFILNYGYITIPMMALTAFLLISILLFLHAKVSTLPATSVRKSARK